MCTTAKNMCCFNTQPPEGGWKPMLTSVSVLRRFNTQPPEGGWGIIAIRGNAAQKVSTHSRLKAAGSTKSGNYIFTNEFQHTAA